MLPRYVPMLALTSDSGYSIAANPALRSIIRPCRRRSIQNLGSEYEQVQETALSPSSPLS